VHAAGVLHGDFAPRNVVHGKNGPVIIDFGHSSTGHKCPGAATCPELQEAYKELSLELTQIQRQPSSYPPAIYPRKRGLDSTDIVEVEVEGQESADTRRPFRKKRKQEPAQPPPQLSSNRPAISPPPPRKRQADSVEVVEVEDPEVADTRRPFRKKRKQEPAQPPPQLSSNRPAISPPPPRKRQADSVKVVEAKDPESVDTRRLISKKRTEHKVHPPETLTTDLMGQARPTAKRRIVTRSMTKAGVASLVN
jgi:hypothetical protein